MSSSLRFCPGRPKTKLSSVVGHKDQMTDRKILRETWMRDGSYLNKMFHAGDLYNQWLEIALLYIPDDILDQLKDGLLIISNTQRDACRVPRSLVKDHEIVLLSERIMPKQGADTRQPRSRYFIFCVLHEIAHAFRKHLSPVWDNLTKEQNDKQEAEADVLAFSWFNARVKAIANPLEPVLTKEEIKEQEDYFRDLIKKEYENAQQGAEPYKKTRGGFF